MRLSITQLPEFPESNVALARHTTDITKGVLQLINSSIAALPEVKEYFVRPFVTPVTHLRWPCMFGGIRVSPPSDERVPSLSSLTRDSAVCGLGHSGLTRDSGAAGVGHSELTRDSARGFLATRTRILTRII